MPREHNADHVTPHIARLASAHPSRREVLLGTASLLVLAACGSDRADTANETASTHALINRFADGTLSPGRQRLPVVLGDSSGLVAEGGPSVLTGIVRDLDGAQLAGPIVARRHDNGVPTPYWPFLLALGEPGTYELAVEIDNAELTTAFTVTDPAEIPLPSVGQPLPPVDTPTVTEPRGVDPICTRDPICPLHDLSLRDALAAGKPVAYVIGTPAFCKTASCGPGLEFLLEEHRRLADTVVMVHAEVYTDTTIRETTEAVKAYRMPFEPALFIADAQGTIVERIDSIWDGAELRETLDRLDLV